MTLLTLRTKSFVRSSRFAERALWAGLALGGSALLGYAIERLVSGKTKAWRNEPSDTRQVFGEGTRDAVDEASWESFPASDPPAYGSG